VAVLLGYAISGERTLEAFYERLHPFATAFMALFGRERLPARSTLSRFLAALSAEPVEALRKLFLADLVARQLSKEEQAGGLWDRQGRQWMVFDVDGTREAARQRALPKTSDRPLPQRRLRPLCAAFLHRAQARRSRAYAHHGPPCAHSSIARHVQQSRERPVSRRAGLRSGGSPDICEGTRFCRRTYPSPPGWTIWDWSSPR